MNLQETISRLSTLLPEEIQTAEVIDFLTTTIGGLKEYQRYKYYDLAIVRMKGEEANYEIDEPLTIKEELQDLVDEGDEYKIFLYWHSGISRGNYKQIEIKELTRNYTTAAIAPEIHSYILDYNRTHTKQVNPKHTVANIITTITLEPTKVYISKTGKILFNFDDDLYITERYDKPFMAKDKRTEMILKDLNILFLIFGTLSNREEISLDNIDEYLVFEEIE